MLALPIESGIATVRPILYRTVLFGIIARLDLPSTPLSILRISEFEHHIFNLCYTLLIYFSLQKGAFLYLSRNLPKVTSSDRLVGVSDIFDCLYLISFLHQVFLFGHLLDHIKTVDMCITPKYSLCFSCNRLILSSQIVTLLKPVSYTHLDVYKRQN